VTDLTVLRLPHVATERLIEQNLGLARHLRDKMLKSLEAARQSAPKPLYRIVTSRANVARSTMKTDGCARTVIRRFPAVFFR
jgi:hypothetical protein